jgi:hypothetical protein
MSKVAIQGNASGTGTFTIAAPNSNTDRTLTLPDEAGTVLTSASDITSQAMNGPAFKAKTTNYSQSLSAGVWTVLEYKEETFDTDGCYNTSTYAFTPTTEGYYQVNAHIQFEDGATQYGIAVEKNGTRVSELAYDGTTNITYPSMHISDLVYLNGSTDYIKIVARADGLTRPFYFDRWGGFSASMVRSA